MFGGFISPTPSPVDFQLKENLIATYPVVIPQIDNSPTETPTPTLSPKPFPLHPNTPTSQNPPNPPTPSNMAATLACIRSIEGGYTSVNPAGYYGAYQFAQGTWNSTASAAGRPDLVGVNPATVSPADQDAMAVNLISRRGLAPWPTPNRVCR